MTQAIITKYIGPTNTKGARVKATNGDGIKTYVVWNHAKTTADNHKEAIATLRAKLGWMSDDALWSYGWLGDRMVAVCGG